MIFSDLQVQDLLAGKTVKTKVQKKDGEYKVGGIDLDKSLYNDFLIQAEAQVWNTFGFPIVFTKNKRLKWQVGRDYCVQVKGIGIFKWHCKHCKRIGINLIIHNKDCPYKATSWSMRVVLLDIKSSGDNWLLKWRLKE